MTFHPVLTAWFEQKFGLPTPVQQHAWEAIRAGEHTLIASPTGSGKTLAALLPCLNEILQEKERNPAPAPGVRVLYVTPLKALNNDIQHHVFEFIAEMGEIARQNGLSWPGINAAVRTGDTTSSKRAAMLKNPPDLLITTPESFYILMTSPKGRAILETVEQIIVDEIHDLAADKRGVHLSLTLERHVELCGRTPQRIGVSATQKPLERVAQFLGGWEGERPRNVAIVESRADKKIELMVTMPEYDFVTQDKENIWTPIVKQLVELMESCSTALVFVNNRRLCERLTLRLNDFVGGEIARSHHSSVSKEKRLEVERLLKEGHLKCLIATSSLELGIDVGHVDLVIQIDSPKQTASGVQRFGRAGHQVDGTSRGVIVAKNRQELIEIAVLSRDIVDREIEEIRIPRHSLDVLSQQVVAMVGTGEWSVERVQEVIARSDCYREFPRARLEAMLNVLAGFYPFARPLLDWNRDTGVLAPRRNTALTALMNAGTIPQTGSYPVYHIESNMHLGELDEEFVHESRAGDVFQLGTSSWMIQQIRRDRVYVTESANSFSEIPFWKGEGPGRSLLMGRKIGAFLDEVSQREDAEAWLEQVYFLEKAAAKQVLETVQEQCETSVLPTDQTLVLEHFRDELNHTHFVLHSLYGKRVNRTWMLALRQYFENTLSVPFHSFAKDNGIQFVFPEWPGSADAWERAVWQVSGRELERLLMEAVPASSFFAITFRHLAETSLLLARGYRRTPLWTMRLRSEEMLKESLAYAQHFPLIEETLRECLHEHLDVQGLQAVLQRLEAGELRFVVQESRLPSPFARQYLAGFYEHQLYESDGFGRDVQLQLMTLHKDMAAPLFGADSMRHAIDPQALAEERHRLKGGELRDAEDLYRVLKERGDLSQAEIENITESGQAAIAPHFDRSAGNLDDAQPQSLAENNRANEWLRELAERHQIERVHMAGEERWICRDERESYAAFPQEAASVRFIVGRYMRTRLSFTEQDLRARYALGQEQARRVIQEGVEEEQIEQAPFLPDSNAWTSRKVLSRLIRASLQTFRKQAEPAAPEKMLQHMLALHHLTPDRNLQGVEGLREIIGQLQGLFLPAPLWENVVFPARLVKYRKEDLDLLCASGEVLWIGKAGKIAFFLAASKELYAPFLAQEAPSKHPEVLELLERKGASFLASLNRDMGLLPSELLNKLLELVWGGHISNDQFAPLRAKAGSAKKEKALQAGVGRWYSLRAMLEQAERLDLSAMAWVQQALQRHCIVAKSTIGDDVPFAWNSLQDVLKKLEEWGTVARGVFVQDVGHIQFSTKEMVAKLRQEQADWQGLVLLSAVDPANPFGTVVSWPEREGITFSRKAGNFLVVQDGRWVLWVEGKGKRIYWMVEPGADFLPLLRETCRALIRQQGLVKLAVESWDGVSVAESAMGDSLRELGAERDRTALVLWSTGIK